MRVWERVLHEFAKAREPMPWFEIPFGALYTTAPKQMDAVEFLMRSGHLTWSGIRIGKRRHVLYRISPQGLQYWADNIRDAPRRKPSVWQPPRWTHAQKAVAQSPVSVFDLPRVPIKFGRWKDRPGQSGVPLKGEKWTGS